MRDLQGVALFDQCVKLDLEGIVAKPEVSPYRELKGKTTLGEGSAGGRLSV